MALANVALTDTFDTWRTRTNQLVVISNQITEGSLTTNGTIISTNTSAAGAINVTAGVIRVQGNNFTSNQITATSNTYLLTVSSTNSGRLGSTIFFNIVGSNSISDVSTANIATANAVNALNQNVVAGLLAGNNYTNQVGAASNTWANTLSTVDRAIGNSAANSANAYTVTVGVAGNNYSIQVGAAANTYANALYVSSLQNANNDANSANAFAVTIGAAANTWANTKLANTNVTIAGNLVSTGVFVDSKGDVREIPLNTRETIYALSITDTGKVVSTTSNVFVPNAVFSSGNTVSIFNSSALTINIIANSGVTLRLAGQSNNANKLLAQNGVATLICVAANNFVITGAGLS